MPLRETLIESYIFWNLICSMFTLAINSSERCNMACDVLILKLDTCCLMDGCAEFSERKFWIYFSILLCCCLLGTWPLSYKDKEHLNILRKRGFSSNALIQSIFLLVWIRTNTLRLYRKNTKAKINYIYVCYCNTKTHTNECILLLLMNKV